jgi:hypothetical protein
VLRFESEEEVLVKQPSGKLSRTRDVHHRPVLGRRTTTDRPCSARGLAGERTHAGLKYEGLASWSSLRNTKNSWRKDDGREASKRQEDALR